MREREREREREIERERERRWGNGERSREGGKKKDKKKIVIRRWEGDRVRTAGQLSPSFLHYCSSLAGLRLPESVLVT